MAYATLAPEIVKALEEGLPMSKVHALFEARLGIGYRQFVRYANRSRRTQEREHDPSPRPVQKPARATDASITPLAPLAHRAGCSAA